ncbi:hypothetical protein QJS04_geneDACA013556 [Acorus gramineus]|uniref:Gamma-tubulin complex component n=1 Tax=Acorus gramineus TaxID=55184 RepID=A0AAV9AFU0_ACOGR|nr:hypothetical protein QJS04_geneDACA013556 [Acorus gramineus]
MRFQNFHFSKREEMTIDSLFQNLKLEDPILPSKAWESIPSESGGDGSRPSDPGSGSRGPPIYDPWTVSESHLVRLVMNALQGAKSAIDIIEKLSTTFCSTPADRSSHRIPSLWHRSTSMAALGNILKSLGRSGLLVFLLQKFVDYFQNPHLDGGSKNEVLRKGNPMGHEFSKDESATMNGMTADVSELERCGCHSLVNQAFSVAVRRVLEGYICALNTLFASAQLRRSSDRVNPHSYESWGAVGLTRDAYSLVTLLEVYVHTKELRSQIESLGNVCLSKTAALISGGDLVSDTSLEFHKFPRGADLLTYLYVQLRDSDPVHSSLLKFLFVHSCEPYCGFIKSWIYRARINDPHKEFMVEYLDELPSCCTNGLLQSCKERDGVSVPCFLKDICPALLRAGQQLQILIKLLEMCNISPVEDHGRGKDICFSYDSANLEDVLPFWSGSLSDRDFFSFSLTFRQRNIEAMTTKRELIYTTLQVKLENLFKRLSRYRQATAFGTLSNFLSRRSIDTSFSNKLMFDKGSISHTSQIHKDFSDVILDEDDSDISGLSDESLCGVEPLDTSECSSSHEEHDEHAGLTCLDNGNALYKTFETERPWELDCILQRKHENTCSISPVRQQQTHVDLNNINLSHHSQESHTGKSEVTYIKCPDYYMDGEKENFNMYRRFNKKKLNSVIDGNHNQGNENMEVIELDDSYFNKPFVSDKSEFEPVGIRIPLENAAYGASPYCLIHRQWNSKYNHRTFNVNPMLSKATWTSFMYNSRDSHTMGNQRFSLQCFNFSSVEDPCESYKTRSIASPASEIQVEDPHVMDSKIHTTINDKEEYTDHDFLVDQSDQSVSCSLSSCSSRNLKSDLNPEDPPSICGGSNWESSLQIHSGKDFVARMDRGDNCTEMFDMPQDIVIEKCIRQEILLQYKFVSGFTIKLLEEGFNLREHLLALRRYHFMELGDWADSFINSLWHHVFLTIHYFSWCFWKLRMRNFFLFNFFSIM